MKKLNVSQGSRFGNLTIIKEVSPHITDIRSYRKFLCRCDCGNEVEVLLDSLRNGKTTSCGCYRVSKAKEVNQKTNIFMVRGDEVIGFTSKAEPFRIDFEDLEKVKDYCWCKDGNYFKTRMNDTTVFLHRFILNLNEDEKVKFVNKDTTDIRKQNLKITKNKY